MSRTWKDEPKFVARAKGKVDDRTVKHCPSCIEATEHTTRLYPKATAHPQHSCDLATRPSGNAAVRVYHAGRHCISSADFPSPEYTEPAEKVPSRHKAREALHVITQAADPDSLDLLADRMPRTK